MKKEISIKKTLLTKIVKSFIISTLVFFILEHFGEFNYHNYTYNQYIVYDSSTANDIYSDSLLLSDLKYPLDGYLDTYSEKFPYYFQATIEDLIYIIAFTIILILVQIFNEKYKFKLN